MLYFDKLAMLAVLGFGLVLAWMTVPPSDLQAKSIEAMPLKGSATLGATYEFKLPTTVRMECAAGCNSLGLVEEKQGYKAKERDRFERAIEVAYSAFVTPLHR
ncbi:hypothetical protein [Thalassospira sp.]|uniref:hypothetical protein n=1 Tax=Thalassospira sp. TaxID=1912094 RepID=UPI0025D7CAF4|nr:hypothetical protein [Thalassospira sp.]